MRTPIKSTKDNPVSHAIILLSGGMDSAVALAIALEQGYVCHALSIRYGQRHYAELSAAQRIVAHLGSVAHKVVDVDLRAFGGSALTAEIPVPEQDVHVDSDVIPITYVPARNTIMLSIALGYAEVTGAQAIFVGVNAVDYSGYPDCRPAFIEAFEKLANVATKRAIEGYKMRINAPLLHWTKAEIIQKGIELGVDFSQTVSCYQANIDGLACGRCDACHLRRLGFEQAGVVDNTRYQIRNLS